MGKPKHIPIRTCVACRETDEKRDLLRVVRQPDGSVLYDPKGKLSGRGAYVCASSVCIALAQKRKQLERSLKVHGIAAAFYTELTDQAAERGSANSAIPGRVPDVDKQRAHSQPAKDAARQEQSSDELPASANAISPVVKLHESEGEKI